MGERLVRFGHPVRVFALLDGAAAKIRRVEQLVGELLLHRLSVAARPRVADEPPDAERQTAVRIHFDRHLVVRPADTARLHLEARLHVVERLLEHLERVVTGPLLDDVEALVEDAFGRALLADRKSTRLNSSHLGISHAVFCLLKKAAADSRESRSTTDPCRADSPAAPCRSARARATAPARPSTAAPTARRARAPATARRRS